MYGRLQLQAEVGLTGYRLRQDLREGFAASSTGVPEFRNDHGMRKGGARHKTGSLLSGIGCNTGPPLLVGGGASGVERRPLFSSTADHEPVARYRNTYHKPTARFRGMSQERCRCSELGFHQGVSSFPLNSLVA